MCPAWRYVSLQLRGLFFDLDCNFGSSGDVPKWSKGAVCKTVIHRFESGRRLNGLVGPAGVVELVDTGDLKSPDRIDRIGSSPIPGTHKPLIR